MFLNQWSVALSLLSLLVVFLMFVAGITAFRVLRFWDPSSDTPGQIKLENETWLASALVEYGLAFQIASLVLFVLAADNFSTVIVGAMCATGSLTANNFGLPVLFIKIAGVFLYGFWIVLHNFDISSEKYPLLKIKFIYLIVLLPILAVDITLQTLYISKLEPDIITSCCAVIFGEGQSNSNLYGTVNKAMLLLVFYGAAILLYVWGGGVLLLKKKWMSYINGLGWFLFLLLSLFVITTVFSSYIYAMPYHRCPFCILKSEYSYIGFLIYSSLISGAFFGMSSCLSVFISKIQDCKTRRFHAFAVKASLIALTVFLASVSYDFISYRFFGGEL